MRKILLVIGAAVALASCGAKSDIDAAEARVEAFHAAYDQEKYGPLWDRAAPTMKEITPRAQFLELMVAVRAKLGVVKSSEQTGWNINKSTEGSRVELTYETTFENGIGTETFVFDTQDPPRLMGWHVVSPALLEPGPAEAVVDKVDSAP